MRFCFLYAGIKCSNDQSVDKLLDAHFEAKSNKIVTNEIVSLATLSVGTTAVEGPISAIIRCILSGGGGGGDRWFGAQPLKHTRPS